MTIAKYLFTSGIGFSVSVILFGWLLHLKTFVFLQLMVFKIEHNNLSGNKSSKTLNASEPTEPEHVCSVFTGTIVNCRQKKMKKKNNDD